MPLFFFKDFFKILKMFTTVIMKHICIVCWCLFSFSLSLAQAERMCKRGNWTKAAVKWCLSVWTFFRTVLQQKTSDLGHNTLFLTPLSFLVLAFILFDSPFLSVSHSLHHSSFTSPFSLTHTDAVSHSHSHYNSFIYSLAAALIYPSPFITNSHTLLSAHIRKGTNQIPVLNWIAASAAGWEKLCCSGKKNDEQAAWSTGLTQGISHMYVDLHCVFAYFTVLLFEYGWLHSLCISSEQEQKVKEWT